MHKRRCAKELQDDLMFAVYRVRGTDSVALHLRSCMEMLALSFSLGWCGVVVVVASGVKHRVGVICVLGEHPSH